MVAAQPPRSRGLTRLARHRWQRLIRSLEELRTAPLTAAVRVSASDPFPARARSRASLPCTPCAEVFKVNGSSGGRAMAAPRSGRAVLLG